MELGRRSPNQILMIKETTVTVKEVTETKKIKSKMNSQNLMISMTMMLW